MVEKPEESQTAAACDAPDAPPPADGAGQDMPIRPRALVIGFILAVGICAVTPFNNVYRGATPLGGSLLPPWLAFEQYVQK